jgi:hypothetical protein
MSDHYGAPMYYGLDGHDPVPVAMMEWATQFELRLAAAELGGEDPWRVARTEFPGGAYLSTVFLGLDHRFGFGGPPILFETMLFGAEDHVWEQFPDRPYREDLGQWRYSTWDAALAGHMEIAHLFVESGTDRLP